MLPTIPDPDLPPTGILLTDKQLRLWQHSNPIGYAAWFQLRSELDRHLVEAKRHAHVADVVGAENSSEPLAWPSSPNLIELRESFERVQESHLEA